MSNTMSGRSILVPYILVAVPNKRDVLGNQVRILTLSHGYPTMSSGCRIKDGPCKARVPFPLRGLMHAPKVYKACLRRGSPLGGA